MLEIRHFLFPNDKLRILVATELVATECEYSSTCLSVMNMAVTSLRLQGKVPHSHANIEILQRTPVATVTTWVRVTGVQTGSAGARTHFTLNLGGKQMI